MRPILAKAYAAVAYLAFLLPIAYLVGFLSDAVVPKTVDHGAGPVGPSLVVDTLLLLAFGVQHSVMARSSFKRTLERWIPDGLERSTYVLASGVLLSMVFWLWRPIPMVLWDVSGTRLAWLVRVAFGSGLAVAVWATFALSHLHLFGVSQTAAYARGDAPSDPAFRDSALYRVVRHPMTAGLLLMFWSAPRMSLGHAVFAAGMTIYSLAATILEERDLMRKFPNYYGAYRERVPALVPIMRPGLLVPRRSGLTWEALLVGTLAATPVLSVLGSSVAPPEPPPTEPPSESGTITVDGNARTFTVFDPAGGARAGRRPLVLALHGTGGSALRLQGFLGGELEHLAAKRGWMVVYPEALDQSWHDCRSAVAPPPGSEVDDVGFIRRLVWHLAERGADPSRVYALGYSGGGHMAFRLALEAPSLVSGIAVFGASPPRPSASTCHSRKGAVPVLMVNGTADPVNPFGGGDVITPTGIPLGPVMSSEEGARFLEDVARGRADVRLVRIQGGGHVVPGPRSAFPAVAGRTTRSFEGVREALAFFEAHTDSS